MVVTSDPTELPRKLDDGLVVRHALRDDGPELAEFNSAMHGDDTFPGANLADWTLDLFELHHPTFQPERDVVVVEDSATGRIVSTLFLIPQVWSYAGVRMPVGMPELIATHPDYRRRGLVRTQFEIVHEWSRALGHLWQFIGGIPWYYRQFGYTYALDRPPPPILTRSTTPAPDGYSVRLAEPADVEFLARVSGAAADQPGLICVRDAATWTLELSRRRSATMTREVVVLEQDRVGPIGYAAHHRKPFNGFVSLRDFQLLPGQRWLEPAAALAAYLNEWLARETDPPAHGVRLWLPPGHPGLRCLSTRIATSPPSSYGFYVRIADFAAFLTAIKPVLEARLASSPAQGWTGTFTINLYTESVRMEFADGCLGSVAGGPALPQELTADASMPADAFVHVLLGNRDLNELERTIADFMYGNDTGALLLDVLFPRMPLASWELG